MTVYKILNREVKVSTGIENAMYIEREFSPYINSSVEMMKKWYNSQSDCAQVLNHIDDIKADILTAIIDDATRILNNNNIYTIDEGALAVRLFNKCFDKLDRVTDDMVDELSEIEGDKQSAIAYRKARKDSRAKWIGGGFGVSGAVKGAVKAGAMNAATGMAHSLWNTAGNITSSISAGLSKQSLYSRYEDMFGIAAGNSIWCIMDEMRAILKEEKNIGFEFQTLESKEKGDAIYNNYMSGNIPSSQKQEMIVQALNFNYYNHEIYETLWRDFGDETGDLKKMAEYFGISLDDYIVKFIESYENKVCEELCPLFMNSKNRINASVKYEEEINASIEKIRLFYDEHYMSYEQSKMIKSLNEYLDIADKLKRTVEGVLYESINEACDIKHDIDVFNGILSRHNIFDEGSYDAVRDGEYLSQLFVNELENRFNSELVLRKPENILETIFAMAVENNRYDRLKSIFSVIEKCGNIKETRPVFEQICVMQPNEIPLAIIDRSIGLFSDKGKGKSGILFTNLNLRIFSKQLLAKENEVIALEDVKHIEALGDNKYTLFLNNGNNYEFNIRLGDYTIEEQIYLAELIHKISRTISNVCGKDRMKLWKILNIDGAVRNKCTNCGIELDDDARFCTACGAKQDRNEVAKTEVTNSDYEGSHTNDERTELSNEIENTNEKSDVPKKEQKNNSSNMAIISLILSIISVVSIFTVFVPMIAAPIGIITGFKGKESDKKKTAIVGIVLNIIVLAILFL